MDAETIWEKKVRNAESITPNFDETDGDLPKDYWDDWMNILVEENKERLSKVEEDLFEFLSLDSVEYIFTVCVRMRLPGEIRYIAALYFDSFMRKQTRNLYNFVAKSNMNLVKKDEEWGKIEANLSRQIPLRVCSCIQLASKEFQYHTSLSTKDVVSMLRSLGHAYTLKAVAKSELRVARTLNFSLPKSPTVYPESILKSLSRYTIEELDIDGELNMQLCWDHVLLFMDMFFLYNDKYIQILLRLAKPNETVQNIPTYFNIFLGIAFCSTSVACLKSDFSLLGAGLVDASISIVHSYEFAESLLPRIAKLVQVCPEDIAEISFALKKLTTDDC